MKKIFYTLILILIGLTAMAQTDQLPTGNTSPLSNTFKWINPNDTTLRQLYLVLGKSGSVERIDRLVRYNDMLKYLARKDSLTKYVTPKQLRDSLSSRNSTAYKLIKHYADSLKLQILNGDNDYTGKLNLKTGAALRIFNNSNTLIATLNQPGTSSDVWLTDELTGKITVFKDGSIRDYSTNKLYLKQGDVPTATQSQHYADSLNNALIAGNNFIKNQYRDSSDYTQSAGFNINGDAVFYKGVKKATYNGNGIGITNQSTGEYSGYSEHSILLADTLGINWYLRTIGDDTLRSSGRIPLLYDQEILVEHAPAHPKDVVRLMDLPGGVIGHDATKADKDTVLNKHKNLADVDNPTTARANIGAGSLTQQNTNTADIALKLNITDTTGSAKKIGSADMVQKSYQGNYVLLNNQSATPATPSTGVKLFVNTSNNLSWVNSNGRVTNIISPYPGSVRAVRLPNKATTTLTDSTDASLQLAKKIGLNVGDSVITKIPVDSSWFVGNSIFRGQGISNPSLRIPFQIGTLINTVAINRGISGSTLQQVTPGDSSAISRINDLTVFPRKTAGKRLIILEYGRNDIPLADDTAAFRLTYYRVIDTIMARGWPANRILLAGVWYGTSVAQKTLDYSNVIKSIASVKGTLFADVRAAQTETNQPKQYLQDQTHPNDEGAILFANTVVAALSGKSGKGLNVNGVIHAGPATFKKSYTTYNLPILTLADTSQGLFTNVPNILEFNGGAANRWAMIGAGNRPSNFYGVNPSFLNTYTYGYGNVNTSTTSQLTPQYYTAVGYLAGDSTMSGTLNSYFGALSGRGIRSGNNNTIMGATPILPAGTSNLVAMYDGAGNPRFYSSSTTRTQIGGSAPLAFFDVPNGNGITEIYGGDDGAATRTTNTNQVFRLAMPYYANTGTYKIWASASSTSTTDILNVGGGTSAGYAMRQVSFYTANNQTTLTGTEVLRINNNGLDWRTGGLLANGTQLTGLMKLNGSSVPSAAVSNTDYLPVNNAAMTGTPTAPTAAAGTNTTQIATAALVFAERTNTATLTNKTLTSPQINTPLLNTTSVINQVWTATNTTGAGNWATAASGTVTSITPGYGHTSSTPITTSGTITIDTALIRTAANSYSRAQLQTKLNTFYSTSASPTIVVGGNIGTGGTVSIVGSNKDGIITVNTGVGATTGYLCTVTMSGGFAYPNSCTPVITHMAGTLITGDVSVIPTSTSFQIYMNGGVVSSSTYQWTYHNGGY